MTRYFIYFSYKGTAYHGWQRQPNGLSVQEVLEKALSTLLRTSIAIVGAGRTDAGVHARQMVAHFDASSIDDLPHLVAKLNRFLPIDICISRIVPVTQEAHARFSATSRRYEYWVTQHKNPFLRDAALTIYRSIDFEAMNAAAAQLLAYTDFASFCKLPTDVKTTICDVRFARWEQRGDIWVFTIEANRFLRNMVRAIVGTLLAVGYHKLSVEAFKQIIESKNRSAAGESVPAEALYLVQVTYPTEIFL